MLIILAVEKAGTDVANDTQARSLVTEASGRRVTGVDAVVTAAGGFESCVEVRTKYMGPAYNDMRVRGVRYNTGHPIEIALAIAAKSAGNWRGGYVSMVNAKAPDIGSDVNPFHGYHYSIAPNHDGKRFLDEGCDWRSKAYEKYGHELMERPYREGFVLADVRTDDLVVAGELS